MDYLKVYRGVTDICPVKIQEYYSASYDKKYLFAGDHTVGHGMYFAFNEEMANTYISVRKAQKFSVLGRFTIKGNYKVYDNLQPSDSDKKISELESLLNKTIEIRDSKYVEIYGKSSLHNDDFLILSSDEINAICEKESRALAEEQKRIGFDHAENEEELKKLYSLCSEIKIKINELRTTEKYDISIHDYDEVCIHSSEVKFNLESFDIDLLDESKAAKLVTDLKIGDLNCKKVLNIDGQYADVVSRWISENLSF